MDTPVLTQPYEVLRTHMVSLEPEAIPALSVRVQGSEFWTASPKGAVSKIQTPSFFFPMLLNVFTSPDKSLLPQWRELLINDCFIISLA